MGALKWGLKAPLGNVCSIVYNCALLWPFSQVQPPFAKPFRVSRFLAAKKVFEI